MVGQKHPPKIPSLKSARSGRITDFFQPVKQSAHPNNFKRQLDNDDVQGSAPTKKLKVTSTEDEHTEPITTVRLRVEVATPKPHKKPAHGRLLDDTDSVRPANKSSTSKPKKKPLHARLLDDVDGGLADRLVGRFEAPRYEEIGGDEAEHGNKGSEDGTATGDADDTARRRRSKAPSPQVPSSRPKKRPSSARLLDDTDGGLNDVLAGRFETTRYEEPIPKDKAEHPNNSPKHDNLSDEPTTTENNDIDATPRARDRFRTPSPQRLPTTPQHHINQNQEEHDSSPMSPSDSPSSFLLASPVAELPAPESSPVEVAFPSSPPTQ